MAEQNSIEILVKAEVTKALNGLKSITDETKKVKGAANDMGSEFLNVGNIIKGVLVGVVANALKNVTKLAIEFLDLEDDFNSTFSGIAGAANRMRDSLVTSLGLSTKGATELLLSTGQLAQSFGFTTEKSLELSGQVINLAEALARSRPGTISTAQAADALTRALAGPTKGLLALGIKIDETEIKQQALKMGLGGVNGQLTQQERAQVVLEIATKKSSIALADLASGQESLADKLRISANRFQDVRLALGLELLKVIEPAIDKFRDLTNTKDSINTWGLIFRKAIQGVILLFNLATAPVQFLTRQLINLGLTFFNIGKTITGAFQLDKVIDQFKNFGQRLLSGLIKPEDIGKEFSKASATAVDAMSKGLSGETVEKIWQNLKDGANGALGSIKDQAGTIGSEIVQLLTDMDRNTDRAFKNVGDGAKKTSDTIKETVQLTAEELRQVVVGVSNFALSSASSFVDIAQKIAERNLDIANQYNDQLLALDASRRDEILARNEEDYQTSLADLQAKLAAETDATKQAAIQRQIDRLNSDREYENKKNSLQEESTKKEAEIKRRGWLLNKGFQIAAAAINTAQAALSAFAATIGIPFAGPVLAPIAAATAAAFGVAQTALIASEPIPSFAEGGLVEGPFPAMVGHGREAILPASLTNLLLEAAGAGGSTSTTNNDTKNITLVANGIQDPTAFINKAQRVLGNNVFGGNR